MITFTEAREIILDSICVLPLCEIEFTTALGKVLADDIFSKEDIPLFKNSAMDGYAVIARDTSGAGADNPVKLEIVETIFAGYRPMHRILRGKAARIMTGGVIPDGADSVVVQENTRISGHEVLIFKPVVEGENIRLKGEDCKAGELIIKKGTVLGPAEIGMFATLGITRVRVIPLPRVAIIATGDELVEPWEPLAPGKIRNSNSYSVAALVSTCRGVPELLGISKDDKHDLEEKIKRALCSSDLLITIAGASVGEGDVVREVLGDLGAELFFWRVAIRPGKPTAYGRIEGVPYFCLPGNPVSCMVTFLQFVSPAILKMQGINAQRKREVRARFEHDVEKKKGLRYFYRVKVRKKGEVFLASTTGPQGSGILTSMIHSDGLAVINEDVERVKAGEEVVVELFRDW